MEFGFIGYYNSTPYLINNLLADYTTFIKVIAYSRIHINQAQYGQTTLKQYSINVFYMLFKN